MAHLNVNPTRMERTRQKGREKTARRGHKLLKDKSDEMLRNFMRLSRQNKILRDQVERDLNAALQLFMTARVHMTATEIENVCDSCMRTCTFETDTQNIMGLVVPKIILTPEEDAPQTVFTTPHPSFNKAIQNLSTLLVKIVELANTEKACSMLACEIVKTRQRVNALEHSVIPRISETVRFITMKLAENERSNQVRLMKVKELLHNSDT